MYNQLDTFKRCLTGAMTAMAKDEKLEKFYKELMRFDDWNEDEDEDEEDANAQSQ